MHHDQSDENEADVGMNRVADVQDGQRGERASCRQQKSKVYQPARPGASRKVRFVKTPSGRARRLTGFRGRAWAGHAARFHELTVSTSSSKMITPLLFIRSLDVPSPLVLGL
jgi:hypothetical protein